MRFTRDELLRGLADVGEADLAAKSGRDGRVAVERLLVRLLAERERRGAA